MPLLPLQQWICDFCEEVINKPSDGYIEWIAISREQDLQERFVEEKSKGISQTKRREEKIEEIYEYLELEGLTNELEEGKFDGLFELELLKDYLNTDVEENHNRDGWGAGTITPSEWVYKDFKIVHHGPLSPRKPYDDCYHHRGERNPKRSSLWMTLPLEDYLGTDGLSFIYGHLDEGPNYGSSKNRYEYDGPTFQIADLRDFMEFARRLTIPFYEEARLYYPSAKMKGYAEGFNEVSSYSESTLRKIINDFGGGIIPPSTAQKTARKQNKRKAPNNRSVKTQNTPAKSNSNSPDEYLDNREAQNESSNAARYFLQGSIGQDIVRQVFSKFGYVVHPYGAENTLGTQVLEVARKREVNREAMAVRRMPDFVVSHQENAEIYQIEVKSTKSDAESWSYNKRTLEDCQRTYPDSYWVICLLPSLELYVFPISDLDIESLPVESQFGKPIINLRDHAKPLHKSVFKDIREPELSRLTNELTSHIRSIFQV